MVICRSIGFALTIENTAGLIRVYSNALKFDPDVANLLN